VHFVGLFFSSLLKMHGPKKKSRKPFSPHNIFEFLMADNNLLKITVFQNASLCSLVQRYQHLSPTTCLRFPAYLSKNMTSKAEDLNHVNTP